MRSRLVSVFSAFIAFLTAVVLIGHLPAPVHADQLSPDLQNTRAALDKYQDPFAAIREGYLSSVGCVEFTTASTLYGMPYPAGAMGVHFINMSLVGPTLDPMKPQVLIYEPTDDGKLQLVRPTRTSRNSACRSRSRMRRSIGRTSSSSAWVRRRAQTACSR